MKMTTRAGLLTLAALSMIGPAPAQEPMPDEARDRQVMARFLDILEKSPRRGTALDRVYGYHVERGSLDAFTQSYRDRVAKDPKDGAAWMILGLIESQRGRDAAAVADFRKAEETRPDDALASYYLGQALVLVGQPDAAAEAFERAITRIPARADLLEVFQALGRVHQRANRPEKALEVWNRLEKLFPDDPRVQEQIASTLAEEAEDAQALARYEALAKKAADPYRKVQFRMDAAELKAKLGRQAEALKDLEGLLAGLNPESWLYRETRRRIEEVFLKGDDQTGLAAYYEGWLKQNPEDVEAMARLGRSLAIQGRQAEARRWLDEALKRAPSLKELRQALIEQLVQEKKYAEATAQYEAMAKADPNNPDALREWGRLLLKDTSKPEAERKRAAAEVWMRLVAARPKDPATAVQVAELLRQAGLADEAVAQYKRAIALAPGSPQYYEYLGEYYHTLKRPKDALATWSELASGGNRNAKNLGRLAEVLANFGYKAEALAAIGAACDLEPRDFDLRFRRADLLQQAGRTGEAWEQLEAAEGLADEPEQAEAVLTLQLEIDQATGKLGERAEALRKELEGGKDATAARWRRLARLEEANQKLPEALAAINQALALDDKSVPSWVAAARIREASGDLGGAADAYRKLAALDRRARTEYLTNVAKLEAKLGRRDAALKAGREILAAAPGNPESYQTFAELCFQLGRTEEGLDALRRAVRANPADPKAVVTLAENLARQFRTEEAIELYWRAFDKAANLEGKLNAVGRLAELYLQRSQFDRLIARLRREGREEKQPREEALYLAQAYSSAGDFGTARQELERLLTTNARDPQLLQQLSALAESDGDFANAAKYQKQLNEITPGADGEARLAGLYAKAGEGSEAEAIWTRLAGGDGEPKRVLQTVDHLLAQGKAETVLDITGRLLRKRPDDWEALYREGLALSALDKTDEAARRFQALLDLRLSDDEEGEIVKAARKPAGAAGAAKRAASPQPPGPRPARLQQREGAVWWVRLMSGLEPNNNFGAQGPTWAPEDFGQARMVALAWQFAQAQRRGEADAWLKGRQAARDRAPHEARPRWDLYYLALVRQDGPEIYEAARDLARTAPNDPAALRAYLTSLGLRVQDANQQQMGYAPPASAEPGKDRTPPLPAEEIDLVLASYRTLRGRRPASADSSVLGNVMTELRRARRGDEAERIYREALADATDPGAIVGLLPMAGERGDLDALLTLFDRYDRAQGGQPSLSGMDAFAEPFARAMNARAGEKKYEDVLKILDRYLAWLARPDEAARRARISAASSGPAFAATLAPGGFGSMPMLAVSPMGFGQGGGLGVQVWLGKAQRYVQLDYPSTGRYFDQGALALLREAFELYKRDDLFSDLLDHFRKQAGSAPDDRKVYPLLARGYLLWWDDDRKDEAIDDLTRAAEVSGDPDLRLELAELRARRAEPDEALALIDSFEPLDQKTMQRRETMALGLAVQAGDVPRARAAAERLFNLRLDLATQLQLAGQMHRLGMHELAEAVLARARRKAGNATGTLLMLMQQYQQQDKTDVAIQIAHQLLRRPPAAQAGPGMTNDDGSRNAALQVLARSGKLDELIERTEAQLKASPESIPLLRSLADLHRAADDKAKVREVYERMARLRPDDAGLRFQVAASLLEQGDPAAAVEQIRAALKREPALLMQRYWEVQNAFQQAGKMDELASILDATDLRRLGNSWMPWNLAWTLLNDEKTRGRGMALFRKIWRAFPNDRAGLLGNLQADELWQTPELYDFAREAVLPAPGVRRLAPWAGIEDGLGWSAQGRLNSTATRLLDSAARRNMLEPLAGEVEAAVGKHPEWLAGRALLALIRARLGQFDAARPLLSGLIDREQNENINDSMSLNTRLLIGQEIENLGPLRDLVLALYGGSTKPGESGGRVDYDSHPIGRLVAIYRREGRRAEARDLLLRIAARPIDADGQDPDFVAYQRINRDTNVGRELLDLGFPGDAAPLLDASLADPERVEAVRRSYGDQTPVLQQARDALARATKALDAATLPDTLKALLTPAEGGPAVRLVLAVQPHDGDRAAVTSLLAEALRLAAARPEILKQARSALDDILAKHPKDISARVADALLSEDGDRPAAADRLLKLVQEAPLEDLSAGARANSRQRAEASRRLGLWLAAQKCWGEDSTKAIGDALADQALEAARRQTDPAWAVAMLREWGQRAFDRGDKDGAERTWARMLDLATTPVKPPRAGRRPARPSTTPERFQLTMNLARLAAERSLVGLSIRAAREALANGPPAAPGQEGAEALALSAPMMVGAPGGFGGGEPIDPAAQMVLDPLRALEGRWRKLDAPADAVYECLRDAVLPEGRPAEVFLYAQPFGDRITPPADAGALLAHWAAKAGRAGELKARIAPRREQPLADLPALVVLAQLGLATGDRELAGGSLDALAERLAQDTLPMSALVACHAALPALDDAALAARAVAVLGRAAKNLAAGDLNDPAGALDILLARVLFRDGREDEARQRLKEYVTLAERGAANIGGDYGLFVRKQALAKAAAETARAGRWAEALEDLGRFADAPSYSGGDPPAGAALGRLALCMAALPARERLERLRAWTLPSKGRKSVRLLSAFVPEDAPPSAFGRFPRLGVDAGIASTAAMLIDSARGAGALDGLADELAAPASEKVENAETLLILARIAQGRGSEVKARLESRLAGLKKPPAESPSPPDPNVPRRPAWGWPDVLLARACLAEPSLRAEVGEPLVRALIVQAGRGEPADFLSHLRRDLARAIAPNVSADPGLSAWVPATLASAEDNGAGAPTALWVSAEGLIQHVVGPGEQLLILKSPMTGTFTFSAEVFDGGGSEDGATYGGLPGDVAVAPGLPEITFSPSRLFVMMSAPNEGEPAGRVEAASHRLAIEVAPGVVRYLLDGHRAREDKDPGPTSPWLALTCGRGRQTVFRNPTIQGEPEVPREVRLTHADRLDGWVSGFYGETRRPRPAPEPDASADANARSVPPEFDWSAADGEVVGRRVDRTPGTAASQSRLYYHRPLLDGESLSYEFFYEPGSTIAHPALGRVALLIGPGGIRLHWMTDGDDDWTGLGPDNAIDDPPGRRGEPRLRSGAWNSARISVAGGVAVLEINGETVYEHKLAGWDDRQFAFFHFKDRTEARVRDVVLKGDWRIER